MNILRICIHILHYMYYHICLLRIYVFLYIFIMYMIYIDIYIYTHRKGLRRTLAAMESVGISPEERAEILRVVAAGMLVSVGLFPNTIGLFWCVR